MSGAIGAGEVLQNSEGLWIGGFTVNLGLGQVRDAEIWGLFFGLKLAISHNPSPLIVEMDSALLAQLIQMKESITFHLLAGMITECKQMMDLLGYCRLQHVYHKKNSVADCLANASFNGDLGLCLFGIAPAWVAYLLANDVLRVPRPRLICF